MNNPVWKKFNGFIEARNPRERVVLLGATLVLIVYAWAMLGYSALEASNAQLDLRISNAVASITTQTNRAAELNALLSDDPNSAARTRQRELQQANADADARLEQLFSQLIDPQQMSRMLADILQRETSLVLVNLENLAPELLHASGLPDAAGGGNGNIQLFKHGLHMVFEGSFLETVRLLRSLEQLEDNFYWENLEFRVQQYPTARISLDIYTLSTQEEWIGV